MLKRAKRASHIDAPASSYAIMRRARPYRGENPEPGKDVTESLTPRPELENNQDPKRTFAAAFLSYFLTRVRNWTEVQLDFSAHNRDNQNDKFRAGSAA
jgi:hypothetical protein